MYFQKIILYTFVIIGIFLTQSYGHPFDHETPDNSTRNIIYAKTFDNNGISPVINNTVPLQKDNLSPLETIVTTKVNQTNNTTKKDLNKLTEAPKTDVKDSTENVIKYTEISHSPIVDNSTENSILHNSTAPTDKSSSSSGAKRRAFIVFGSLGLFALIYFAYKMYRRRRKMGDISFIYDNGDLQQFKYGMLLSNEAGDNVEMLAPDSMGMNIDSDDEEELELFDLERRKQFIANDYRDMNVNDRLLAKDVDILDLELPGVRSSSDPLNDNDLVNLDFAVDEILRKPPPNQNSNDKNSKNDDFFDVL